MAVEAYIPTLSIVITTAAIDSINPCAIGVLILMLSVLVGADKSNRRILALGLSYIFAVFLVYLLAGLGLLYFFSSIPLWVTEYLSIFVGVLIVGAGLLEIKDFYWYGKGFSLQIPAKYAKKIQEFKANVSIPGVMVLGAFVSGVELPCTGAPYLAIITMLSAKFDLVAALMLVLYNLIFVLPLLIILIMVVGGKKVADLHEWKQSNKKYMRLGIGIMLIAMGWLLMLIANGTINFG
ncbi:MAG: GAP family protein [Candidatus Woesearchaeota archaeon]|nr:GAP family protein [Candidatus Woesearchaeota archaeon]